MRDARARSATTDAHLQPLLSLLTPEAQLLFSAAAGPEADGEIEKLLSLDLDWVEICRLADREKVAPMLWRRVRQIAPDRVPVGADAHLRKLARVVDFQMSYLEQLTLKSANALDRAGIDYTLLKGAALAGSIYGSFARRPMIDLDLLVRASDAQGTVQALASAGWLWRPDKSVDGDFSGLHHLPAMLDPNGMVSVEIHTTLLPPGAPFSISTEAVLQSGRIVAFGAGALRVPNPAYLLLHACVHLTWAHLFRQGGLRTFRDVGAIVESPDMDWPRFIDLAKRHNAGTCAFWTLHLAQRLLGVGIPESVLQQLRPPLPGFFIRALERHFTLVLVPNGITCPSASLRRVMWSAGILPQLNSHGDSRPWKVLELRPQDRPEREGRREARLLSAARHSRKEWGRYWASLFLASPAYR